MAIQDNRKIIPSILLHAATGNMTYTRGFNASDLQGGQKPQIVLIPCADSREESIMFGPTRNWIFDDGTAGAMVNHPMLSGSSTYAGLHISDVGILMVVGHTGCGLVAAAVGDDIDKTPDWSNEPWDLREHYLPHARQTIMPFKEVVKDALNRESRFDTMFMHACVSEVLVDEQVEYLKELHAELIKAGKLVVMGGMFGFHDMYPGERGQMRPININGEKNPERIYEHDAFSAVRGHGLFKPHRFTADYDRSDFTDVKFNEAYFRK